MKKGAVNMATVNRATELFNKHRELNKIPFGVRVDDNIALYQQLYDEITKEVNPSISDISANIQFVSPSGDKVSDLENNGNLDLLFYTKHISEASFDDFIFAKKTLGDLISEYCKTLGITVLISDEIFHAWTDSWNRYLERIGYDEANLIVPPENIIIENKLKDTGVVWCHNKSCSGKTFTAINILKQFANQVVFNPCFSYSCHYEFVKLILAAGSNITLLIDDIQCDIDKAHELMNIAYRLIDELKKRNVNVFFVSWSTLYDNDNFAHFENIIPVFQTRPEAFIMLLKRRIKHEALLDICENNIALINASAEISLTNTGDNAEKALFSSFVFVSDSDKIAQVYKLCVLGAYEYEPRIDFIGQPELNNSDIRTIKIIGDVYNAGHRQICEFISTYLESCSEYQLPEKDKIIRDFISSADNKNKWKFLKQLIGDDKKSQLLSISPIWSALHEFENELATQTQKDPSWQNTPSSMYFVLSSASLLGVVDSYKNVLSKFCENFYVENGKLKLRYDKLKTTYDFTQIRKRMIDEDKEHTEYTELFESGMELDCEEAHKNWVLGLVVGLRDELSKFGYNHIYEIAVGDLFSSQQSDGSWYPRRVPWVTARILIGLSKAGYKYSDEPIKKGIEYLFSNLGESNFWEARTGGWNNVYETSSLCLEAIFSCGYPVHSDDRLNDVIKFLKENKYKWMAEDNEIDGTATACILSKIHGIEESLVDYITTLCDRRTHEIIQETENLDFDKRQSCDTTQIAYFVVELCWFILKQDMPNLLREYVNRSRYKREGIKDMKKIFISYCDEGAARVTRYKKIADRLSADGHDVLFYDDAPTGTNIIDFMRNASDCDLIMIMGTSKYKEKATKQKEGGVAFEDLIISSAIMTTHRNKIIPIAFGEFSESIPAPLDTSKGLRCKKVTKQFLDKLANEIKNK